VWDPADPLASENPRTAKTVDKPQPTRADGVTKVNLFCAGHAMLPDGRLLAIGGHIFDGEGLDQAALYQLEGGQDPTRLGRWTATESMNAGRWYPTATALPDGSVLALGGGIRGEEHNLVSQVWRDGQWRKLPAFAGKILDLYPRVHLLSTGTAFISGPLANTFTLDTTTGQLDTAPGDRNLGQCDYAPAVMYRVDKIIYIGGGNRDGGRPTYEVETIDFTQPSPAWRRDENQASAMHFARRQHNAVILPDGTVLVTGGTRGGGSFTPAFNDLGWGSTCSCGRGVGSGHRPVDTVGGRGGRPLFSLDGDPAARRDGAERRRRRIQAGRRPRQRSQRHSPRRADLPPGVSVSGAAARDPQCAGAAGQLWRRRRSGNDSAG
jgi:hypothetical protein